MLNRRAFVCGAMSSALVAPLAAEGRRTGKVPRIGVLLAVSPSPAHPIEGFRQGLRDLGYEEGRNIALEYRWTEGSQNRFPEFALDLVRLKVDVIVAGITAAALAARNATQTIPIVTVLVYDPVRLGLATSFARPGGNVTGLTSLASSDIYGKQLELLKEAVSRVSRVGVLANPANPTGELLIAAAVALLTPIAAWTHSGGLDAYGCHTTASAAAITATGASSPGSPSRRKRRCCVNCAIPGAARLLCGS